MSIVWAVPAFDTDVGGVNRNHSDFAVFAGTATPVVSPANCVAEHGTPAVVRLSFAVHVIPPAAAENADCSM